MNLQKKTKINFEIKLKYRLSRPPCRIEFFIATQGKLGLHFHVVHAVVYDAVWLGDIIPEIKCKEMSTNCQNKTEICINYFLLESQTT